MFCTMLKTNCIIQTTSKFSSANAFNLGKSKVLSFGKGLIFPKRKNLDSSQLTEFPGDNFKFDEYAREFSKRADNTVGKGEIAPYEQFLLSVI